MIVSTTIKNLTDPEKEQFQDYLAKKVLALEPMLDAHYPDADTVKLDARMQKHDKHTAFEVELLLHLPRLHQPLVGSEIKHTITEPTDAAFEKLESQMVKHFKRMTETR